MSKKIFQVLIFCGLAISMNGAMAQNSPPSRLSSSSTCEVGCRIFQGYCNELQEKPSKILFNKNILNQCTREVNQYSSTVLVDCAAVQEALASSKVQSSLQKAIVASECSELYNVCIKNCTIKTLPLNQ